MRAELVEYWGSDLTVVNAARVSFDKESNFIGSTDLKRAALSVSAKENKNEVDELFIAYGWAAPDLGDQGRFLSRGDYGLIHHLAKHKHTSCFEHQGATFRLIVPIFIARQIQRHRTFSYNEVSRRYVDTTPEFFYPDVLRAKADNVKQGSASTAATTTVDMAHYVGVAVGAYEKMLEDGVAPELARMILPQNMYTEFYMTGNLRNWAHFLKLRLDGHAQLEVRQIAEPIANFLANKFPVSMEALMRYD